MTRRKRSDSATAKAETMQEAALVRNPPSYVNVPDCELPYWHTIVEAKLEWMPHEYILAAELAHIYHDIVKYSEKERIQVIETENYVKEDVSAAHKIQKDLVSDALRLCRQLQIHARAVHGESEVQRERNKEYQKAKKITDNLGGLIARPIQ